MGRTVGQAGNGLVPGSHREVYEKLRPLDPASLTAEELEALADAAWWLSRLEESIAARQHAYSAYVRAGENRRAGYTGWFLFYDYLSKGEEAAASGWLHRARGHLEHEPECVERGYLLVAEADNAQPADDASAADFAQRAIDIGRRLPSADLTALALQSLGRILIAGGDRRRGIELLDEAMTSVLAGELSPFITGWVYCNVLGPASRSRTWDERASGRRLPRHGVNPCPRDPPTTACAVCTGWR